MRIRIPCPLSYNHTHSQYKRNSYFRTECNQIRRRRRRVRPDPDAPIRWARLVSSLRGDCISLNGGQMHLSRLRTLGKKCACSRKHYKSPANLFDERKGMSILASFDGLLSVYQVDIWMTIINWQTFQLTLTIVFKLLAKFVIY